MIDEKERIGVEVKLITQMSAFLTTDICKLLGKSHEASRKALAIAAQTQALKSVIDGAVSPEDFSYCYGNITEEQEQMMFDFVEKCCDAIINM